MLAGSHLLTIPQLQKKTHTLAAPPEWQCRHLAGLLGYAMPGDLESLLSNYLARCGIGKEDTPLTYALNVCSYDYISQYGEDALPKTMQGKYMGLYFIGDTFTDDYGEKLEEIERKHPGLGHWLLCRIDESPCNILTPFKLLDEAELYLDWEWNEATQEYRYAGEDEEAVTPETFRKYYPEWAYVRYDDPPPDLSRWPQLRELERRYRQFLDATSAVSDNQTFITLDGADMFCGVIGWTCGRNDIGQDIAYRVCDELYTQMMYCNGAYPGCMQFEFILDEANAERNRRMAELLRSFCFYLVSLDHVLNDISREVFQ